MILRKQRRDGLTAVECAVVFSTLFLLIIGVMVGGVGVFRYQEMAALSYEASRWASVRGYSSELKTLQPAATAEDVYNNAILPKLVALDKSQLKYTVTWSPDNRQGSLVTVSLNYHWIPEAYLGGITLSASSTIAVSY